MLRPRQEGGGGVIRVVAASSKSCTLECSCVAVDARRVWKGGNEAHSSPIDREALQQSSPAAEPLHSNDRLMS